MSDENVIDFEYEKSKKNWPQEMLDFFEAAANTMGVRRAVLRYEGGLNTQDAEVGEAYVISDDSHALCELLEAEQVLNEKFKAATDAIFAGDDDFTPYLSKLSEVYLEFMPEMDKLATKYMDGISEDDIGPGL